MWAESRAADGAIIRQAAGLRAVGIDLHHQIPPLDDGQQVLEPGGEERLPARHADPLEPALPGVEVGQEKVGRDVGERPGAEDEVGIMAVGAAEVAAGHEDRRSDEPGKVLGSELL